MINIQIISNKKIVTSDDYFSRYSAYNSPLTFDMFDINIINLQDEDLWVNEGTSSDVLNCSNDLESLSVLIENSIKSKIIVLLPLNYSFKFYKSIINGRYQNSYFLKDRLGNFQYILRVLLPLINKYNFIYEQSLTQCLDSVYNSSFSFLHCDEIAVTKACGSGRATTIWYNEQCLLTTLIISDSENNFKNFIKASGLINDKPNYPQWLIDYERFDDATQKQIIETNNSQIEVLKCQIDKANEQLHRNLRLKSILTENGERLVNVVFDILEDILSYDLSEFQDKKREDFLIKLDKCTFIGEIKGINSNVKNENVSQLDVHYQYYLADLEEKGEQENVKALLIINSQRNKPINDRDEVHENQISLAKRNCSLIISTISLLSIYEKFLDKQITSEQVIELFLIQVGLIDLNP